MKKILVFLLLFPVLSSAQWKGKTSNDDQRTMMIQRHMDLYPKNDQSQLKNIFLAESKINVNGVNVISPAELADFEKLHHKIFKNITFEIGANITSKYENGQIWTHVYLKLVQTSHLNMKMDKYGLTFGHGGPAKEKNQKRLHQFQFI